MFPGKSNTSTNAFHQQKTTNWGNLNQICGFAEEHAKCPLKNVMHYFSDLHSMNQL